MVALTYDVRTVRIPIPRLALGAGRDRLRRVRPPAADRPHWARTELVAAERRRETHRDAAFSTRAGAGF
ncbi:hypothetical protein ACPPVS_18235 [Cellulomonas sp. McL0617]|uniref:hypothetical protein n=1 Tax=Cellulomonas sp. McL0617 TaxID=3415675 RepID=UPI003CF431FC